MSSSLEDLLEFGLAELDQLQRPLRSALLEPCMKPAPSIPLKAPTQLDGVGSQDKSVAPTARAFNTLSPVKPEVYADATLEVDMWPLGIKMSNFEASWPFPAHEEIVQFWPPMLHMYVLALMRQRHDGWDARPPALLWQHSFA